MVLYQNLALVSKRNVSELSILDFLFVIIVLYKMIWWINFEMFCHRLKLKVLEGMCMCEYLCVHD